MKYRYLGSTPLVISPLCLRVMNLGASTDRANSFALMDRALQVGINFFDTANAYPWRLGDGVAEQIAGQWLAQGGGRREQVILATKVYARLNQASPPTGRPADQLRRACEASLRRLQTDYIDLYQLHHFDPAPPWEEIWPAMEQLVQEGKVLHAGSSNFTAQAIAQAAHARHGPGLVSEQHRYNLIERTMELDVLPTCRALGVSLIPWSPVAGGLLGGALQQLRAGQSMNPEAQKNIDKYRGPLEAYEALCHELGEAPGDVALAWLLHQPGVAAPIVGPRYLEQFDGFVRAAEIELAPEAVQQLEAIWPSPVPSAVVEE